MAMLDTHKLARKLRESGFDERHAEGLTDALRSLEIGRDHATRRDLELVRQEVRDLEFRIDARLQALRGELTLIKLLLLAVVAGIGAIAGKLYF
ncbi:hypothetical protein MishRS11D_06180 [Methylomagnum ishizawai]|nr:hypothetical protein MishRS11D_06180 [Methylomagnum ishizawai]